MSELVIIPVDRVEVADGNPRARVNEAALRELAASIERFGVLQPVIVEPGEGDTGDGYLLVAGQRRLLACKLAGVAEIPAFVREGLNGDARSIALVENLQREELTPIEEAKAFEAAVQGGMTPGELATAISRTPEFVKDRLALLQLPAKVQAHISLGDLTLRSAAALKALAPAGELVVARTAELVADPKDELESHDVETNPAWVLEMVLEDLGDDAPFLVQSSGGYGRTPTIDWPDPEVAATIEAKAKQLPESDPKTYSSPRRDALRIQPDDINAARAYGCLLELGGLSRGMWISDPVWLADRLNMKLDKAIKSWERKAKKAAKDAGAAVTTKTSAADAAKLERQAQHVAMLAARERNVSLGIALTKELHAPKPTADNMRLVAELLLTYTAEDLGRRGLRYTDEVSQVVSTRKDGTISRVTHLRGSFENRDLVKTRLDRATTPEQILGVMLQAIVAAKYADTTAAPQSDRHGAVRGLSDWAPDDTITELVTKVAAPVLPGDVVEHLNATAEDPS